MLTAPALPHAPAPSGDELLARARTGSESAFAALVREHQAMVFGLAYHFLHNRAQAEELAQDVFLAHAVVFFLAVIIVPAPASAQGARLQLDHLDKLAAKAHDTVDVTVDAAMLKQTAGFLAGRGSDLTKVQQLLEGITGIYVKSFQFDAPDAYAESDVEAVRKQVAGPGWSRVVGVRGKRELTEIYFWTEREVNRGLVVIAAQSNQLTIVNIVGRVDLASLGALGPMIPKLPESLGKARQR